MGKIVDKSAYVVDEKKIIELFFELIKVDSPSKNERLLADLLKSKFAQLGIEVIEDNTAVSIQGNCGNIIGLFRGEKEAKPIILCAHMDTVVSNQGINASIDNSIIRTDGRTILGSDDKAGITAILEAIRMIKEGSLPHGDIYLIFTVAEETGLYGSKNLDLSRINVKMGYVFDSGDSVGNIVYAAPTEEDFVIKIYGKSAHAGVNPEEGINAIHLAGRLLAKIKLGRIDDETTSNVGIIKGGRATNIVPDLIEMQGEIRSRKEDKLKELKTDIESKLSTVCNKENVKYELEFNRIYKAFCLDEKEPVVQMAVSAMKKIGLEANLIARGGGSDANIFNEQGISCVNLSVGMMKEHTNQEFISVDDLTNSVRLILSIIENAYLLQEF